MKENNPVVSLDQWRHKAKREVLEQLFLEHSKDVRAFLVARMNVDENTGLDDVVQEVFARLANMEDLPERYFQGDGIKVSFLITVAHNYVLDAERRKKYRESCRQKLTPGDSGIDICSPESQVLAQKELELVKNVLLRVKPKWRQAFISSRFNHKSYREIAADMQISVKQVEVYISKVLHQMRKALSAQACTESKRHG